MLRIGIYFVVLLFLFERVCLCVPAEDIEELCNRDYFPRVLKVIEEAKGEILMAMYDLSYVKDDPMSPVSLLLEALVRARQRGVRVKVVLELPRWEERKIRRGNRDAYVYLQGKGIDVSYDTGGVVTHSKVIVVDNRIVIVGSTNWSKKALEKNNEANVLIVSQGLSEKMRERILGIKTQYLEEMEEKDVVWISCAFIFSGGAFQKMVSVHASRAMDLYLYLVYEFSDGSVLPKGELNGDFEDIARYLGLDTYMTGSQYRRQIVKVMRGLDKEYGLIRFGYKHGKDYTVEFISQRGEDFPLPLSYWEYGWDKALDLGSKFCLFVNLAERGRFQGIYQWEGSREFVSGKYGISPWAFTNGMRLLQRYDVLDVEYARYNVSGGHSGPTIYRYKGLYDLRGAENELDELREGYGDIFVKAKEYAGIVYKDLAPNVIKRIIGLIQKYGLDKTDMAFRKATYMKRDNPKRNLEYIIGILRTGREITIPE